MTFRHAIALSLATLTAGPIASAQALAAKPAGHAYPSGPSVPENLLRIELRFSRPLREPLPMDRVKLIGENGQALQDVFLDLPLPNPDATRVTLLLNPARVKSGVGANLAIGRALHFGSTVTLVVDDPALARPLRKTWRVTGPDTEGPNPALWTFDRPTRGTRLPMVVHLDRPIASSSEALIAVRGPDNRRVAGVARLENGESTWQFTPAHVWRTGTYAVVTHPELEDPAGNRPCAPFEATRVSSVQCNEGTTQTFETKPPTWSRTRTR